MNLKEYYDCVPAELACPIVTAAAHVAMVDVLPVDRVDFLLGNDLSGIRVFSSSMPSVAVPEETFEASADVKNGCWVRKLHNPCLPSRGPWPGRLGIRTGRWLLKFFGATVVQQGYQKRNSERRVSPQGRD